MTQDYHSQWASHLSKISWQSTNSCWDISVTNRTMNQSTDSAVLGAILIMRRLKTSMISVDFVHRLWKAQSSVTSCDLTAQVWDLWHGKYLFFLPTVIWKQVCNPMSNERTLLIYTPLSPYVILVGGLLIVKENSWNKMSSIFPLISNRKDMHVNQHISSWFGPCLVFPPESWL